MKLKNVLFITWDGPQTSYIEGLFIPIFKQISKKLPVQFHIMQFTWASADKSRMVDSIAKEAGIKYKAVQVLRKPTTSIGNIISLLLGTSKIEKYIHQNNIDIVMPRSTVPASMVLKIKSRDFKILFDADGLPIEERVDFGNLRKGSTRYKVQKGQESKMLALADKVITRSEKAIAIHVSSNPKIQENKFHVVFNGRDPNVFKPGSKERTTIRKELACVEDEKLFVYCGSLGPQYGFKEMLSIYSFYRKKHPAKWLIISGNSNFLKEKIPTDIYKDLIVISLPFQQVPSYLKAADIAFAIRQPYYSMQGVFPIKIGEYLLTGIPTIASKGIGDTEMLLSKIEGNFLYDHSDENVLNKVYNWILDTSHINGQKIREQAIPYFSLEAAAGTYITPLNELL